MGEAALLAGQDAMIGILRRELRHSHPKGWTLFHALEDEVHTKSVLADHFAQPRLHILFLAHALLGPLNGDVAIAGKGLDPLLVDGGPLAQNLFADDRNADNAAEEVHDLLGPRKAAQVAVDDNAIEAVINEDEKIAEQLDEGFHGRHPKTHPTWTGQAHGRRQGFPSRR